MKSPQFFLLAAFALTLSSCAALVSGPRKKITVESNPPGAQVTIQNKKGEQVASLTTPGETKLKRSSGFFVPAKYTATFEKQGYKSQDIKIGSTVNPWTFGNLLVGGVIGGFLIDPAVGATFEPTPSKLNATLVPEKR